jgi:hypothetical protein
MCYWTEHLLNILIHLIFKFLKLIFILHEVNFSLLLQHYTYQLLHIAVAFL